MTEFTDESENAGCGVFRVMLRLEIVAGRETEFENAWLGVGDVITGQPTNLGQWLLKSTGEPGVYYIMSDWLNEPTFREFEHSTEHIEHRKKLHPFRAGGSMTTMQVVRHLPKAKAVAT